MLTQTHRRAFRLRLPGCMLAGALSMFAFTLSPIGYVGVSDPPLSAGSAVWLVYALLLCGLYWLATDRRAARLTPGMVALSLLFGAVNYFATTLFAYDTWSFLRVGSAPLVAALSILGQSATMAAVLRVVCGWLESGAATARGRESTAPGRGGKLSQAAGRLTARFPGFTGWLGRHPTLAVTLLLPLCWSPYLLAYYPGTVIWDMGEMVGQFFGVRELTTWHPVFTTWLLGGLTSLGRLLGSDNLGVFLFTLLQTFALSYAASQSLRLMARLGARLRYVALAFLFFAGTPIFASFAQAVGKDTLYTAALMLFAVRLTEALRFGAPRGKALGELALAALLSSLLRSNGLYVVLGATALVMAFGLRGKASLKVGGALAAALLLALGFTYGLLPALNIKDETASGLYSVAFQQSARTLRDHGDTVTQAEYAEIDRVLDAKALPALYESNISDPVKFTFRQYGQGKAVESEALARYRQTWLSMLTKYPWSYAEAFIAGNSGYYAFTPKINAARTYHFQGGIRFVFETYPLGDDPRYLHTAQIPALEKARALLAAYARGWRRVPVLELTMFCPTYTWLLVAAGYSLARRRRMRELMAFGAALLSLGVCLLSPVNDYFRYFLPIAAMWPMLMTLAADGGARNGAD